VLQRKKGREMSMEKEIRWFMKCYASKIEDLENKLKVPEQEARFLRKQFNKAYPITARYIRKLRKLKKK